MQKQKTKTHMKNIIRIACLTAFTFTAASTFAQSAPTTTETPKWSASGALGFSLAKGNTDNTLLNANLLASKKWDRNELDLGLDGAYGESDGTRNTANAHAFAQYNRLFTERAYGLLRADGLHDDVADVQYRVTLSPGAGYYFIKGTNTFLRGEVGPGYVIERVGGVDDDYVTLRLAERFETKINDRVKLWQSLEWLPAVDDFEDGVINGEIGLETSLTKSLNLRTYVQDTYDTTPAPGLKHNDVKLIVALAYKFS
jgi:putative salt-induced outer membrane protein YdiY